MHRPDPNLNPKLLTLTPAITLQTKLTLTVNINFFCTADRSLSFFSSGLTTWIPETFTVTSEHTRFYF